MFSHFLKRAYTAIITEVSIYGGGVGMHVAYKSRVSLICSNSPKLRNRWRATKYQEVFVE